MPLVFIIMVVVSVMLSPKPMKKLIIFHVGSAILGFIALFAVAFLNGATRSGPNAGMFEGESIYLLIYAYSSVITMFIGAVSGIIIRTIRG